jgi:hypothetical protein
MLLPRLKPSAYVWKEIRLYLFEYKSSTAKHAIDNKNVIPLRSIYRAVSVILFFAS